MWFGKSGREDHATLPQSSRPSISLHDDGGMTVAHSNASIASQPLDMREKPSTDSLPYDRADSSEASEQPVEYGKVDSAYSWVIVLCASGNLVCTLGVANSFGVFSTYYINYIFPEQESTISWISTMVSAVMFGGAVVTGPLTNRFGFRLVSLTGAIICCLGLVIASFTSELWHLILTQGVMFGLGASLILSPSSSLPAQWHDKHRALATGLTVAGSGAGGMVFTQITQSMMESIGHKWTLRVLGLIILAISGTASMFYKHRIPPPKRRGGFWRIARDRRLIVMGLCGLFVHISFFVPWYYLSTAALWAGQSKRAANNLVLFMNVGSTVGRIAAAFFATAVGPITSAAISYLVCSVMVVSIMVGARSMAAYVVLAFIYGGLAASFASTSPLILSNIFGTQAVTTAMGITYLFGSCGILIGNPSQGRMVELYDRPNERFTSIAIWGSVGHLFAFIAYMTLKYLVLRGTGRRIWARI